jgi:hypothetical protein
VTLHALRKPAQNTSGNGTCSIPATFMRVTVNV